MGKRFGRLVVLDEGNFIPTQTARYYTCQCDCGGITSTTSASLRGGDTKSCGCLRREYAAAQSAKNPVKHGASDTPEYNAWLYILYACSKPKHVGWPSLGRSGARVCAAWKADVMQFIKDVGKRPGPKYRLVRRSRGKDFEPGNCYWKQTAPPKDK